MAEKTQNVKKEKTEKMPKPIEKVIWLAASVAVAVIGYFIRTSDIKVPIAVTVLYVAFLLFTIIMSAQRTSIERFSFAPNEETGYKGDRKKYVLISIIYYFIVCVAVFYIFFSLWFGRVLYI